MRALVGMILTICIFGAASVIENPWVALGVAAPFIIASGMLVAHSEPRFYDPDSKPYALTLSQLLDKLMPNEDTHADRRIYVQYENGYLGVSGTLLARLNGHDAIILETEEPHD
jgi:hypothetical protein